MGKGLLLWMMEKGSKLGAPGALHVALTCYIRRKHFPAPSPEIDASISAATYSFSHRKL